jgi:hypothetical protein
MTMMQQSQTVDKPFTVLREIDLVALCPNDIKDREAMLAATRESITRVFRDFLAVMEISDDRISVLDGFLFLFNEPQYLTWHTLTWWEQRRYIQSIKEHQLYTGRAQVLLTRSYLAPYIGYADAMVAKSSEPDVKRAWMRKRLVLKECFWNGIDTISHAAYYQKKYQDMFPALCLVLCNVIDKNGRETELFFGIDNGTGFLYKKKSRESALFHFFYWVYKFFFRKGVFYIGGLELGLLETDAKLSCHGSGAVVYQGW